MPVKPEMITVEGIGPARDIAVRWRDGSSPVFMWLGGYRSDMLGTKAEAIDHWAAENGWASLRHDYSGHGESGGDFIDGTISRWLEESLAVYNHFASGKKTILIGSSMGAWIALRMAQELAAVGTKLQGMLLIAPAPDFTHELMLPELSDEHREQLKTLGYMEEPSEYSDDPNIFTKALFDDGEKNRVMTGLIETACPIHIIQGMQDPDVPYSHALKLAEFLPLENVSMTLVKDADHRLSREADIELMLRTLKNMAETR